MSEIKLRGAFEISNILSLGWGKRKSRDKNQNKYLRNEKKNEGKKPQKFKISSLHKIYIYIYIYILSLCTNLKLIKRQF